MHSVWVRLNSVIVFALKVLLVLVVMCSLSTYIHTEKPDIKTLKLNDLRLQKLRGGQDRALMSLDIDADLRTAFHWNIYNLYVCVIAEYQSSTNPINQVIIWDELVSSKKKAWIKGENQFVNYALIAQGEELRNNTVTLRLMWDHRPLAGGLYMGDEENISLRLPSSYTNWN